jgi:hypothetical protein
MSIKYVINDIIEGVKLIEIEGIFIGTTKIDIIKNNIPIQIKTIIRDPKSHDNNALKKLKSCRLLIIYGVKINVITGSRIKMIK